MVAAIGATHERQSARRDVGKKPFKAIAVSAAFTCRSGLRAVRCGYRRAGDAISLGSPARAPARAVQSSSLRRVRHPLRPRHEPHGGAERNAILWLARGLDQCRTRQARIEPAQPAFDRAQPGIGGDVCAFLLQARALAVQRARPLAQQSQSTRGSYVVQLRADRNLGNLFRATRFLDERSARGSWACTPKRPARRMACW